ncbi:MAG: hypothetical protein AAGF11_22395 [Myxococcota bacterium]
MPTPLLVLLVVLAVAAGLYVGFTAGQHRSIAASSERPPKSLGTRAREAATRGAVGLWRWNRARKNKPRDDD